MASSNKNGVPIMNKLNNADPHAANIVFSSVTPIALVPLDATQYAPMTMDFYKQIKKDRTIPTAEFVYRTLAQIENRIRQGGYYFWDPLAAAIATEEGLADFQDLQLVVIESEGPESGRTLETKDGKRFALRPGRMQSNLKHSFWVR